MQHKACRTAEKQSFLRIHIARSPDTIRYTAFPADQQKLPWNRSQMEIQLNGETRTIAASWTIAELLKDLRIENRYCAVERNSHVVPREEHSECRLQQGDRIEVVTLVGGG